jgi:lactoylglutathione lyase
MKLSHVTIQTSRFTEEIDFYMTYAALSIQRDMRPMGRNIVFLADGKGDTQIEVIENAAADSGNANLSLGFAAENLDALHARLAEDGLVPTDFVSPVPQVRFFFVTDPAGVCIQFM